MIEKYLNQSGVNCRVSKKAVKDYYSYLYLYGVGNVAFNNWGYNGSYENFDDESKRQYYIRVNFNVLFADKSDDFSVGASEEFAGIVLTLTDDLTLYS